MKKEVSTGYPGIFKIVYLESKKTPKRFKQYVAVKCIKSKRYSKCFYTLRDALEWKNTFLPDPVEERIKKAICKEPNLEHVIIKYQEAVYPTLEKSTVDTKKRKLKFFDPLLKFKINEITPDVIDQHIQNEKAAAIENGSSRFNFDKELEEMKALFNWYRENHDYKFSIPVLKRHYGLGLIRKKEQKEKKMKMEEVYSFFTALKSISTLLYDLAVCQFWMTARIQEVAGLQKQNVDLEKKVVRIKEVAVWDRYNKGNFDYLKSLPKNNTERYCFITGKMFESISRQMNLSPKSCPFVFQSNGEPIKYRTIQYYYNKALELCGLSERFSSTHFLRHSMAFNTRNITGSADLTQAVTGHKDIRMVEHYAGSPSNKQKDAVISVEEYIIEKQLEVV